MIAILVAFGAIGSIIFWGLTRKTGELAASTNTWNFLPGTTQTTTQASPSLFPIVPPTATLGAEANPRILPSPAASPTAPTGDLTATLPTNAGDRNNGWLNNALPAAGAGAIIGSAVTSQPAPAASPTAPVTSPLLDPSPVPVIGAAINFPDVPQDYWARPFIDALTQRGVASGFPDGTYRPDQPVTRAEYARLLQDVFVQDEKNAAIAFSDVNADFWAAPAIDVAVKRGFLKGYSEGDFRPDQPITRLEVLLSLVNGLGLPLAGQPAAAIQRYSDNPQIPKWAIPATATATNSNMVVNYPDLNMLNPSQPTSRAEVAALIHQALVTAGKTEAIQSDYIVKP
jgi:hypothetical protein